MNRDATSMHYVVPSDRVEADGVDRFGGKAARLAALEKTGARVPDWFVIPTFVCADLLDTSKFPEVLEERIKGADPDDADELSEIADETRRAIRNIELPESFIDAVRTGCQTLLGDGPVAVRSSGVAEDSKAESFAGLHESILYVQGLPDAIDAVRRVWASAFTPRVLAYRLRRGKGVLPPRIGVIVQNMVEPAVSGVAFTADPTNGDVETVVVDALWGAGQGLVAEGLEADHWEVDKIDGEISRRIATKETQYAFDTDAGEVIEQPVAGERRDRPCIPEDDVRRIVRCVRELEEAFNQPQDIEFVLDRQRNLHLLQSRPVTTVERRGPAAGQRRTWDNSNIVESYPGITSPLTFTFIQHLYAIVYRRFGELLGASPERMRRYGAQLDHKLGLIRGRVYYNLDNWYESMALLPGWRLNAETLESMLGVDDDAQRTPEPPTADGAFERVRQIGDSLRVLLQSLWQFARIESRVESFEAEFEESYQRWSDTDFEEMSLRELAEAFETMKTDFLEAWGVPILVHYHVMLSHGIFQRLCDRWLGDEGTRLTNDLLCGEGGIATKQASMKLSELAGMADEDPELRQMVLNSPLDEIHAEVFDRPSDDTFRQGVDTYLERYGDRAMNELKLEEPTLRERPERVYQMLRNYLQSDDSAALDPHARKQREQEIRQAAEDRAFQSLNVFRRAVFKRVLNSTRFAVRNRENVRFARSRVYGLVRRLFVAVGKKFAERGILERPDDIFYLGQDEIWDYIRGAAITTRLDALVEIRRREFREYEQDGPDESPDDRFFTYGAVYESAPFEGRPRSEDTEADGDWYGSGCSSGVVEGVAKVVTDPDDDLSVAGDILVAQQTDPGWVPLFASASGLVVERGSALSHAAIVAREMGLPAVVGVSDATRSIESGDRLRIDGEAGTVTRLD